MSRREEALRAGHMEEYKVDGARLYLYWEVYGEDVKTGRYVSNTVAKEGFTVDTGLNQRWRFKTLREADEYIFSIRDKTPADLALQVFGVIVTPDDD